MSTEALRSEMIIPRAPSPSPLEEREDLTREEIRDIQRQLKEIKETSSHKVKREHSPDDSTSSIVKQEKSSEESPPRKRRHASPRAGDIVLAIDDSGVREMSTAGLAPKKERVVIDIDSD